MNLQLFSELKRTSIQVIISVCFLIMNIELITWIILAFWGIKIALRVLIKDIKRSSIYAYK